MPPVSADLPSASHRPRPRPLSVLAAVLALVAVTVLSLALGASLRLAPADAAETGPHGSAPAATPGPVDSTGTKGPFRSGTTPYSTSMTPITGRVPGAATATPLVPMAAPAAAATDRLTVATSPDSIEDYWYWADGVDLTVTGAAARQRVVIEDHAPDGTVETFDPAQTDADGRLTMRLRSAEYLPVVGMHTLVVTAADGSTGRTHLDVRTYQARPLTATTDPTSITRQAWTTTPVTVTAKGFSAHERISLFLFTPDGIGQQVGTNAGLRADADGVFVYQLQAASVATTFGTWSVTVMDSTFELSGSVATDFEVLEGTPSTTVGTMTLTPSSLTDATLADTGVAYALTGLKRWDVTRLTLRTPRGVDYFLGRFRATSNGRVSSSITSAGAVPVGVYRLTAQSDLTGNTATGTFTVRPADGSTPTVPAIRLSAATRTQPQLLDPAQGLTVTVTGFDPGAPVEVSLVDRTQDVLRLASTSLAATTVDAAGRATLRVSSRSTAPVGTYEVRVVEWSTDPILLRAPLTVTAR